eukprot:gene9836-biopygen684
MYSQDFLDLVPQAGSWLARGVGGSYEPGFYSNPILNTPHLLSITSSSSGGATAPQAPQRRYQRRCHRWVLVSAIQKGFAVSLSHLQWTREDVPARLRASFDFGRSR